MIQLRPPTLHEIGLLQDRLGPASCTYPQVGATEERTLPSGYAIDRSEVALGQGADCFARAREALRDGHAFALPWVRAHATGPLAEGEQIAVVARVVGLWWVNVSRIVRVIDEPQRFAFTYGTLPVHTETGEERFQVVHDPSTDEVRYEILAFSRPRHLLARLGRPWSRAVQHRFARGSLAAMRAAVVGPDAPSSAWWS